MVKQFVDRFIITLMLSYEDKWTVLLPIPNFVCFTPDKLHFIAVCFQVALPLDKVLTSQQNIDKSITRDHK